MKDNRIYVAFIFAGAFVVGGSFSLLGDYMWNTVNRGRLYKDIDWSKWKSNWKS